MIQPKPFKYKCPKCGYAKVVKPKSDALNPIDILTTCPKCKSEMEQIDLSFLDKLFSLKKF